MVERFLRYSLEHARPIRILRADTLKMENILVVAWDGEQVGYLTSRRKTPLTLPLSLILSASYARGDEGDTLQYLPQLEAIPSPSKKAIIKSEEE